MYTSFAETTDYMMTDRVNDMIWKLIVVEGKSFFIYKNIKKNSDTVEVEVDDVLTVDELKTVTGVNRLNKIANKYRISIDGFKVKNDSMLEVYGNGFKLPPVIVRKRGRYETFEERI